MLVIITGSSGVGKNTVIRNIEESDKQFRLMPTYTTRDKREGEVEGYPYFFLTKEEFQNKIKENELIEFEYIHNNYYGSSYTIFEEYLAKNLILIKEFGIEGAQNLSIKLSDKTEVLKIFLTSSKKELKKRLKNRGEKQIKLRLKRYDREQQEKYKFDYLINNNNLENTTKIILTVSHMDLTEILPTIPVEKFSFKRIKKYGDKLLRGKILKPIEVSLFNDKLYITKGHEKFIAGLMTNTIVCKKIKVKNVKLKLSTEQIMDWKNLIKKSVEEI